MIVPEHVQHPVHDQPCELLPKSRVVSAGVCSRDIGSDVDIPDHRSTPSGLTEGERDDVGRTAMPEMLAVECRHRARAEERDRHHRVTHALGREHPSRDLPHSRPRQRNPYAVRGDVHGDAHAEANSEVTPPLRTG
jgi:hypothetical protein